MVKAKFFSPIVLSHYYTHIYIYTHTYIPLHYSINIPWYIYIQYMHMYIRTYTYVRTYVHTLHYITLHSIPFHSIPFHSIPFHSITYIHTYSHVLSHYFAMVCCHALGSSWQVLVHSGSSLLLSVVGRRAIDWVSGRPLGCVQLVENIYPVVSCSILFYRILT